MLPGWRLPLQPDDIMQLHDKRACQGQSIACVSDADLAGLSAAYGLARCRGCQAADHALSACLRSP